jgi:hypothetical protein
MLTMTKGPNTTAPTLGWRLVLALGLALTLALPVAWLVSWALEPGLGHTGARDFSFLMAGATGPLVGLVVCRLFRPARSERA